MGIEESAARQTPAGAKLGHESDSRFGIRNPSPGNQSTSARSNGSPERGWLSRRRPALRAGGKSRGAVRLRRAWPLAGPLVRITAMPQRPWPELSAKMVAPAPAAGTPLPWRVHGLGLERRRISASGRLLWREWQADRVLVGREMPQMEGLRLEDGRIGGQTRSVSESNN